MIAATAIPAKEAVVEKSIVVLRPGDVLFFKPSNNWVGWLEGLFLTYSHVAIYYTETRHGLPLIIESIGRGVVIRSLLAYTGAEIVVKRPTDPNAGEPAAKAAEHLADNPGSWYDYFSIPRFVVPKLILAKLGRLLPQNWSIVLKLLELSYHRNNLFICSELIDQAYIDADYPLVDCSTIPLPDDIFNSDKLILIGTLTPGKE